MLPNLLECAEHLILKLKSISQILKYNPTISLKMEDAKGTLAYSSDLHILGIIMQLSNL